LISKRKEPTVLAQYRSAGGTYAELSAANGKDVIKQQLLDEQGYCCAYCTRSITIENMKLEHWSPQSISPPDRSLEYSNMLGCCPGVLYNGTFRHCDTSKGGTPITFDPQRAVHVSSITYDKASGEMACENVSFDQDISDDDRLNLNCKPLLKERRLRMRKFIISLKKMNAENKPINFSKILKSYLDKRTPFDDIIVDYLQGKVAKGL
jgi:uncharacterized protein (TIGR02646 family)